MKYYFIKYPESLPAGWGGETRGPFIKILSKYKNDIGLLEHEKIHVRQWYAMLALELLVCILVALFVWPTFWIVCGGAPMLHPLLYKLIRPYRQWCEVQAYREQIRVGGYSSSDFAVAALVEKYNLDLETNEAAALLVG
ncbi:hypothetical protein D3C84_353720 [compost metagenome]